MQMHLFQEPAREDILRNFDLWLGVHLCEFGRNEIPRYPYAPEVYRAQEAERIEIQITGIRFMGEEIGASYEVLFELYWLMNPDGTWKEKDIPKMFGANGRSIQGYRGPYHRSMVFGHIFYDPIEK
jgi:hypothetical protein